MQPDKARPVRALSFLPAVSSHAVAAPDIAGRTVQSYRSPVLLKLHASSLNRTKQGAKP